MNVREQIEMQKDLFYGILRLHALRSKEEHFELIQLAIDDTLIFDLAYQRMIQKMIESEDVDTRPSKMGDHVATSLSELLFWLSSNRGVLIDEIGCIVDSFGGIEIATYLLEPCDELLIAHC